MQQLSGRLPLQIRWLDYSGIGISIACALHCLAIPLAFALLPQLTLALHSFNAPERPWAIALLHLQRYDRAAVAIGLAIAAVSLSLGWCRHRHRSAFPWFVAGACAWIASFWLTREAAWLHGLAMWSGSACLIAAHLANLRLSRLAASKRGDPESSRHDAGRR